MATINTIRLIELGGGIPGHHNLRKEVGAGLQSAYFLLRSPGKGGLRHREVVTPRG